MPKSYRVKSKSNKTKKNKKNASVVCPIGLKPFEDKLKTTTSSKHLKKFNKKKESEIVKELLSKFAPNSIKPKDDFYDYINFLRLYIYAIIFV